MVVSKISTLQIMLYCCHDQEGKEIMDFKSIYSLWIRERYIGGNSLEDIRPRQTVDSLM